MQEANDIVMCPHCARPLALSTAVRESIDRTLTAATSGIRDAAAAAAREQVLAETRTQLDAKEAEVVAAREKLAAVAKNETDLLRRAREVEQREQEATLLVERRLAEETAKIRVQTEATLRERIGSEMQVQLDAKEAEVVAAREKLAVVAKKEADLLRRAREVEQREEEATLQLEKRLAEETSKIRAHAEATLRERIETEARAQIDAKEAEVVAAREKLAVVAKNEADLLRRAREVEQREQEASLLVERRLAEETAKIRSQTETTLRERIETEARAQIDAKEAEVVAAREKLAVVAKNEADLLRRAREVEQREQEASLLVERRLAEETAKIRSQTETTLRDRIETETRAQIDAKEAEVLAARAKLAEAAQKEIELLRRSRELDDREQHAELQLQRRLTEEVSKTRAEIEAVNRERMAQQQDQFHAATREREIQLDLLKRQLDEAQQRIAATPAHPRGEGQEVGLRDLLTHNFVRDRIADVPSGTAGSDVVQHVVDDVGHDAGLMIWESKNTKAWNPDWLAKLRDDQRAIGADVAVLVTAVLPEGVRAFGLIDGVWVTSWATVAPVATMLRTGMIEVAVARAAQKSRGDKMSMLYDYLTGTEFRNRFMGVIEAYQEMHEDLEAEKRALLTIWKKRERQLKRAIDNLSAFYGDVQGIAGSQLVGIEPLSLPNATAVPAPMIAVGSGDASKLDEADNGSGLAEIFFDLLPVDGRAVGNKTLLGHFTSEVLLRLHLTVGEVEFRACKDALLDQGRIRRAPGQGGAVARNVGG